MYGQAFVPVHAQRTIAQFHLFIFETFTTVLKEQKAETKARRKDQEGVRDVGNEFLNTEILENDQRRLTRNSDHKMCLGMFKVVVSCVGLLQMNANVACPDGVWKGDLILRWTPSSCWQQAALEGLFSYLRHCSFHRRGVGPTEPTASRPGSAVRLIK